MKKTLLNIVAISVAFFLGISINNSCADSDDYRTPREDASIEELWAVVNTLKAEVDSLTLKMKALEDGESDIASGEFFVDGLWFSRDGYCISPLLSMTDKSGTNSESKTIYRYDDFGRVIGYEEPYHKVSIEYNGKIQTKISKITTLVSGKKS